MATFELSGINHLALVCKDMDRTIDFYTNVLGMPLTKTIDLPEGKGKHYFFDCGGGDQLAFSGSPTDRTAFLHRSIGASRRHQAR